MTHQSAGQTRIGGRGGSLHFGHAGRCHGIKRRRIVHIGNEDIERAGLPGAIGRGGFDVDHTRTTGLKVNAASHRNLAAAGINTELTCGISGPQTVAGQAVGDTIAGDIVIGRHGGDAGERTDCGVFRNRVGVQAYGHRHHIKHWRADLEFIDVIERDNKRLVAELPRTVGALDHHVKGVLQLGVEGHIRLVVELIGSNFKRILICTTNDGVGERIPFIRVAGSQITHQKRRRGTVTRGG